MYSIATQNVFWTPWCCASLSLQILLFSCALIYSIESYCKDLNFLLVIVNKHDMLPDV